MKKYLLVIIFNFSLILTFGNTISGVLVDDYIHKIGNYEEIDDNIFIEGIEIEVIEPAMLKDNHSKKIIPLVYDTLFTLNSEGKVVPELVKKYRWINEKELYIKLKSGVEFHDGSSMEAEDVKRSLEFLKKQSRLKALYSGIIDISVVSRRELIIRLEEIDENFLETLAYEISAVVKVSDGKVLGTGRYYVENFEKNRLIINRFERYHGKKIKIKKMNFKWGKGAVANLFENATAFFVTKKLLEFL